MVYGAFIKRLTSSELILNQCWTTDKLYCARTVVFWCQRYPRNTTGVMHPLLGRQMQVGCVKIGDARQITGYISKTVQDRRMVSIKVE